MTTDNSMDIFGIPSGIPHDQLDSSRGGANGDGSSMEVNFNPGVADQESARNNKGSGKMGPAAQKAFLKEKLRE